MAGDPQDHKAVKLFGIAALLSFLASSDACPKRAARQIELRVPRTFMGRGLRTRAMWAWHSHEDVTAAGVEGWTPVLKFLLKENSCSSTF